MEAQCKEADFEEGEIEDDEPIPLNADHKPTNAVSASDSLSDCDSDRKETERRRRERRRRQQEKSHYQKTREVSVRTSSASRKCRDRETAHRRHRDDGRNCENDRAVARYGASNVHSGGRSQAALDYTSDSRPPTSGGESLPEAEARRRGPYSPQEEGEDDDDDDDDDDSTSAHNTTPMNASIRESTRRLLSRKRFAPSSLLEEVKAEAKESQSSDDDAESGEESEDETASETRSDNTSAAYAYDCEMADLNAYHERDRRVASRRDSKSAEEKKGRRANDDEKNYIDKPCRMFLKGHCTRGPECPYSHKVTRRRRQLCKFYCVGACSLGEKCLFAHSEFPCKMHALGRRCNLGDECKFSHAALTDETRTMLEQYLDQERSGFFGTGQCQSTPDVPSRKRKRKRSLLGSPPEGGQIPSLLDIFVQKPRDSRLRKSDFYKQLTDRREKKQDEEESADAEQEGQQQTEQEDEVEHSASDSACESPPSESACSHPPDAQLPPADVAPHFMPPCMPAGPPPPPGVLPPYPGPFFPGGVPMTFRPTFLHPPPGLGPGPGPGLLGPPPMPHGPAFGPPGPPGQPPIYMVRPPLLPTPNHRIPMSGLRAHGPPMHMDGEHTMPTVLSATPVAVNIVSGPPPGMMLVRPNHNLMDHCEMTRPRDCRSPFAPPQFSNPPPNRMPNTQLPPPPYPSFPPSKMPMPMPMPHMAMTQPPPNYSVPPPCFPPPTSQPPPASQLQSNTNAKFIETISAMKDILTTLKQNAPKVADKPTPEKPPQLQTGDSGTGATTPKPNSSDLLCQLASTVSQSSYLQRSSVLTPLSPNSASHTIPWRVVPIDVDPAFSMHYIERASLDLKNAFHFNRADPRFMHSAAASQIKVPQLNNESDTLVAQSTASNHLQEAAKKSDPRILSKQRSITSGASVSVSNSTVSASGVSASPSTASSIEIGSEAKLRLGPMDVDIVPPVPAALLEKPVALIMAEQRVAMMNNSPASGCTTTSVVSVAPSLSPISQLTTDVAGVLSESASAVRSYMNDPRFRRKKAQDAVSLNAFDLPNGSLRCAPDGPIDAEERDRDCKPFSNALLAGFYKAADENDV